MGQLVGEWDPGSLDVMELEGNADWTGLTRVAAVLSGLPGAARVWRSAEGLEPGLGQTLDLAGLVGQKLNTLH
tara:strand:+ start:1418 stop:1636 length:219 start_codon:yes stop_codon:yes gene_type:complete